LLDDPDSVLATVSHQTREEEPETAEATGEETPGEDSEGDDGEPASEA